MALTDSYLSVTEADAYFDNRLDSAAWTALTEPGKLKALSAATRIFESFTWAGDVVDTEQALSFPRKGQYSYGGRVRSFNETELPTPVVEALCETAFNLIQFAKVNAKASTVESISIGPIHLTGLKNNTSITASGLTNKIRQTLRGIAVSFGSYGGVNAGGNGWFRVN